MTIRPTRYERVPCQAESVGATALRLPFLNLWHDYLTQFQREVVRNLCGIQAGPTIAPQLLEQARLTGEALRLDEWFLDYRPSSVRFRWDSEALAKLAAVADDLAHDEGQWKRDAVDLERPTQAANSELRLRIQHLRQLAQAGNGLNGAVQVLEQLRAEWLKLRNEWSAPVAWDIRQVDELREAARLLRAALEPRSIVHRSLRRLRPQMSPCHWLSESQRQAIQRRLFPQIQRAGEIRFEQELRKRQLQVADALLGRPGMIGVIDQVRQEIDRDRMFYQALSERVAPIVDSRADYRPHEIVLLDSLDASLDPIHSRTLGQVYDELVRRAGSSPAQLAERLLAHGLFIEGRCFRPAEWPELSLSQLGPALRKEVERYLGCDDPHRPVRIEQPQTAFDYCATVTPLHPELKYVLRAALPGWFRQSAPYAEFHRMTGADITPHARLFCFPPDRRRWQEFLLTHVPWASTNAESDAAAYATAHPFVAILCQYAWFPLGGLKSLPVWVRDNHQLRHAGRVLPMVDPAQYPELRRLSNRPEDSDDSRQMFESALQSHAVVPIAGPLPRFELSFPRRQGQRPFTASRDEFIAALHDNDDLYNVLFWRLRDAFDRGQLADDDAPYFLRNYSGNSR